MDNNSEEYAQAKRKVEKLKDFYLSLVPFFIVNILLFVINLVIGGSWWFYWVTIFWGIGLIIYYIELMASNKFGKKWEEKKIEEYMKK